MKQESNKPKPTEDIVKYGILNADQSHLKEKKSLLQGMPTKNKISLVASYKKYGYSYRRIAKQLGLDSTTAFNYVKEYEANPELYEQYDNLVKQLLTRENHELKALAIKGIKEKVGNARLYELTGLYKIANDAENKQQAPVQFNQQINIDRDKFNL